MKEKETHSHLNAEKILKKFNSFMVKILNKLGIEGNYLNIMKVIY